MTARGRAKRMKPSFTEVDLVNPPMLVVLKPAVTKKLSEMNLRVIPIAGDGWCGWGSGAAHHDYDVMKLVADAAAYYRSHQEDVLAWMNNFVTVSGTTNRTNVREITARVSKLEEPKVTWPSECRGPGFGDVVEHGH